MKITLSRDGKAGQIEIPKGDYWVTLNTESSQMVLMAGGKDIKIAATRRNAKAKSKSTSVSFYCGGGPLWSLVVTEPKSGEWVSFIEYVKDKD